MNSLPNSEPWSVLYALDSERQASSDFVDKRDPGLDRVVAGSPHHCGGVIRAVAVTEKGSYVAYDLNQLDLAGMMRRSFEVRMQSC